ncbi:tRNA pseudouridine(55) synthase [Kwoniella dejecticola CBS 10117]|uniref:tRNA pseudouridine(55) synthase n=1 Tax=Kwoniella dejecticola CBS 10117 TaxID=1296121 RepID=A0A1A6A9P8_9TREE|nr:tRNA pseudouridine(55) synthase [Kwoniella dejecticola CBS 10117]OBR86774.1 tRNA pseudouridine(55) synthase [Kwoniella dejecticola CBS 10117]
MPKSPSVPPLPLNGLFPIAKPSGPSSMKVIDSITSLLLDSKLFDDPERRRHARGQRNKKKNTSHLGLKIGQGGTLDPLADGVLVIGVNRGTKHLNKFLECSKEYESIGLLGCITTSMDSDDPVLSTASWEHVTREDIEKVLDKFRGEIYQVPPIFSALKMDGKPLYEYARESKPLPRPIPTRKCTVSIELLDFKPASVIPGDGGHEYRWPEKRLSEEEKKVFRKLTDIVSQAGTEPTKPKSTAPVISEEEAQNASTPVDTPKQDADSAEVAEKKNESTFVPDLEKPDYPEISPINGLRPPTFKVKMTVSSGTYVRSIVHDIGVALGCGAHVVKLTRTRQGEFSLYGDEEALASSSTTSTSTTATVTAPAEGGEGESTSTSKAEEALALKGENAGPTGGSIPWSVWTRAMQEREQMLERERTEKEEAMMSGASAEEIHTQWSPDAIRQRRHAGEMKEWEVELLRRFVPVHVPPTGGHVKD